MFIHLYLSVLGLSCGTWDRPPSVRCVGSLAGIQDLVPGQGLNPGPLHGSAESQPLDHQGHPSLIHLNTLVS